MNLSSSAFSYGQSIPIAYTQYGENLSPPFLIENVPAEARALVLIVEDPDTAKGTLTHWIVFNIDPQTRVIMDNTVPAGAKQGRNSLGAAGYAGPKPPNGVHRYFFRLAATKGILALANGVERAAVEKAMAGQVIAQAELMGRYRAEDRRAGVRRSA